MKGEAECEDGTIAGSWAAYPPPLALLELMMMEVTITISMISRPFYPLLPPHPPTTTTIISEFVLLELMMMISKGIFMVILKIRKAQISI